ncbi:MAG: HPr family phosphocarrier protein [Candidatus Latescibacteria bacterium]|nr:HPr family phosphocarrier protein [Candidatus Latescibacterota bacterium]
MAEITVSIRNKTGLHMRPAEQIAQTASKFRSEILISKDDLTVNGKSIMGVMMLAAEYGSAITIQATGEDEADAIATLAQLVEDRFGEPE